MKQIRSSPSSPINPDGDELIEYVHHFFSTYFPDLSTPLTLVVGLSGGSDSMALLYLMQKLAQRRPLSLTFVHVDHKWREESSDQAKLLENLCRRLKVRFIGQDLSHEKSSNNQEAHARKERLRIFGKVVKESCASALVLGHHFDDCIETMLKKIFEGAELSQLGAMSCDVQIGKLRILRPFLMLDKEILKRWLAIRDFDHFEDPTNFDSRFWRGFVRTELLLSVKGALGKEIKGPLKRLWHFANELEEMLDYCLLKSALAMSWGITGMWSEIPKGTELLLRHFFRKRAEAFGTHLPHESNKQLVDAVLRCKSSRAVRFNSCKALVWRNLVFFELQKARQLNEERILRIDKDGEYRIGIWRVHAQRTSEQVGAFCLNRGWRLVWKGQFTASIASSNLFLCLPQPGLKIKGRTTTLACWWNKKGVPLPMRHCVPVAMENEEVIDEWLSGSICCGTREQKEGINAKKDWILHFSSPLAFLDKKDGEE